MRVRWWISLLAVIGVLLHAGLLARHNGSVLAAQRAQAELATSLTVSLSVICHGGGGTAQLPQADISRLPDAPLNAPSNTGDCPLCMGLGVIAAVLPTPHVMLGQTDKASIVLALVGQAIHYRRAMVCPPPRGPPVLA